MHATLDEELATQLGELLKKRSMRLATAESCTGGLIAGALTAVSGSSEWFTGGVVAYANEVKEHVLGVPAATLAEHGAVSRETVRHMARGVAGLLGVEASVAVSGIAGPTGGTPDKPVGTVWLAWCVGGKQEEECELFPGSRAEVREQTVLAALRGLAARLRNLEPGS